MRDTGSACRGRVESWRPEAQSEAAEIIAGLTTRPRYINCKFFYDERGSRLFERITALEEYYPTRCEREILVDRARALMAGFTGGTLVELGSGDCSKISLLLAALTPGRLAATTYLPVDVSESALADSHRQLVRRFPGLQVCALCADFLGELPQLRQYRDKLVCFLGSTVGNLDREQAAAFLRRLAGLLRPGERLLVGFDLVKERAVLERAYNDSAGITTAFNANILLVANRLAGTDFDPADFQHRAFWVDDKRRIEMHLQARRRVVVDSPLLDEPIALEAGETIHTENSHKFTRDDIVWLAESAGLEIACWHHDARRWFCLVELLAAG